MSNLLGGGSDTLSGTTLLGVQIAILLLGLLVILAIAALLKYLSNHDK